MLVERYIINSILSVQKDFFKRTKIKKKHMRPRPTEEDPFKIKAVIQQTEGAVVVLYGWWSWTVALQCCWHL